MKPGADLLCTVAEIREIDRRAIEALGGDGFVLMARAAESAWRRLRARWPEARRIVVLAGHGNNGGDGHLLAAIARREGCDVVVVRADEREPRTDEARRARATHVEAGGIECIGDARALDDADVVVDALLGVGLARAPAREVASLIEAANASRAPVLALDVPSGLDADTGHAPGDCIDADATVAFIALKRGLVTGVADDVVGALSLETLGVDASLVESLAPQARRCGAHALRDRLRPRARTAHKGDCGHVLVVGGDDGYGGAALLAAAAAARAGAGLVTLATRAAHVAPVLASRPEVMVRAIEPAADLAPLLARADVVAVGPGLGRAAWGRVLLGASLDAGRPLVLDADALNLLAEAPRRLPRDAIVTPHPAEAARLLGTDTRAVQRDRYAAATALAQRYGCVAVLKGAGTITSDGTRCAVGAPGNPALATGGSGDVLTGVIAALRAQGLDAYDAARYGVAAHAESARLVALGGERGALAGDLVERLPRVLNP